ncbi:MAG: hypothetical protein ASARMPREDX12_009068 [Alectoria sarmentosa]|nr:MAG: hypothetical protein ASARMPREDX12_009068 [Alectoria sarmentosa]
MAGYYLKTIRTAQLNSAAVFRAKVQNVTLRTLRSRPTEEAERFSHAAKILASNPFEDRALTYLITESKSGFTQVTVYNAKDEDGRLGKERGGIKFSFGRKSQDREIILQAASTLACFLERWPHVLSFHSRERSILAAVALELTSPRANKHFPTISFDFPKSFYRIRVKGIDPDSGKLYLVSVRLRPSNVIDFEVPEIPQTGCVYFTETNLPRVRSVNNTTAKLAAIRTIPDEDKRHEAAIKILRLILWKYHKKIMRLSDVEYATEELISRFCKRSQGPLPPLDQRSPVDLN